MSYRIIFSISSDFGFSLAQDWLSKGNKVAGTYNTFTERLEYLLEKGVKLVKCDVSNKDEIDNACKSLSEERWEVLCIAPASLNPIGLFTNINIDEWEKSIYLNFVSQMRIIHQMIDSRDLNINLGPIILLFAGGGTNSATLNYSAYTVSKIAQIKMVELLDAEISDTRITIIGPGWVRTKIHDATINAGINAGKNLENTINKLNDFSITSMERVVQCCNWAISCKKEVVSGRNFSLIYDKWGDKDFENWIVSDKNIYKLRRFGN